MANLTDSDLAHSNHQARAKKQANKRYATLFSSIPQEDIPMRSWQRRGTGVVVRMIQHAKLTQEQFEAIGEYRLDQYILAGLYDTQSVTELGLTVDPNLMNLPDSTIHVLVGDASNHLLCYASFESAHTLISTDESQSRSTELSFNGLTSHYMYERERPLFPVELAFGQELYASHPEISLLPYASIREMMRMVRNQVIRMPISSLTTIEVIVAASHLLCDPTNHTEALVGCASPELRKLSHRLNIPVAYAPDAIDHLREHSTSLNASIWTPKALERGRFWPLAISRVDIQANWDFFSALHIALDAANLKEVLIACREAQHHMAKIIPRYCYVPPNSNEWTVQWMPYTNTHGQKPTT